MAPGTPSQDPHGHLRPVQHPESPCVDSVATLRRAPPPGSRRRHPAPRHPSDSTLGEHHVGPSFPLRWVFRPVAPGSTGTPPAGELAPPGAMANPAGSLTEPSSSPRWTTRVEVIIPGPNPRQIGHGNTGFGPLRRGAAAGEVFRRSAPPPSPPFALSRPIENLRPRLDPALTKSRPSDPDLTAVVRAYRFGRYFLLKSPWTLC